MVKTGQDGRRCWAQGGQSLQDSTSDPHVQFGLQHLEQRRQAARLTQSPQPSGGGGPGSATTFIVQYIYQTGFAEQIHLYGLAAAASLILAAGLMGLTLLQLRLSKASEAGKVKK